MSKPALKIDDILSADDIEVEAVDCPEWGGTVYVRSISANERDKFEQALSGGNLIGARAALVAAAMCDETGKPLELTDAQIKGLGNKASGPIDRLAEVVIRINKMRSEDVEKLAKN